ncbi:reelin domain-containing protein 1 isoform X1 [Pezoporus wallicus]|uniref:reelin domain-containing protein 1 isoform X1 n=2 Tax=Pezoporus wallicus TaxID=35540 RepID=UPI00254ACC44|nr:reelin domain-containing protein 1 isoform X1 [Pezoporus wallicus]
MLWIAKVAPCATEITYSLWLKAVGSSGAHLIQRHQMGLQGYGNHYFEVNLLVVFHHRMEDSRRAHIAIVGWACTTLCLVSYVAAFSHGASLSACTDMMPRHLRAQLHSPNNYVTVHTNMSFYSPGDKVLVTVRSTRDFMGFLLQARKVSNDEISGTFIFIPPGSKLLACFEDGDTVTHSDKSLKRNLSFVWKAPDQPIGDIKFFISVVQSYFVYWAKIESAVVAHRGQNKMPAGSSERPDPVTAVTPLQRPADPTGMASKGPTSPAAATGFPLHTTVPPASPTGTTAVLTPEPDFGAHPIAEPKQLARPSRAVSGGNGGASSQWLELSLPTQDPSTTAAIQELLPQDNASSYSTPNGAGSTASAATPRLCLMCKEDGQASTESGNILEASHIVTASPSAPHLHTHLGDAAVTTAWFGNANTASNLSSASRQMAERKLAPQPEKAGARGEEEEEVGGNTLPWVTRPAPDFAVPGNGEDPGRGTRLLAAQLGILLVCTAALGLALAAAVRCVCAQHCHKRTEVSFSEQDPDVITVSENGEVMHFRKIRENSFVLVQTEYNWVSPSSSGKKTII